jgi:hypothetical protein
MALKRRFASSVHTGTTFIPAWSPADWKCPPTEQATVTE